MRYITVDGVMALRPCWSRREVKEWFGKRKRVKITTPLKDKSIGPFDREWLAWRVMTEEEQNKFMKSHRAYSSWERNRCGAWCMNCALRALGVGLPGKAIDLIVKFLEES
jgi:hypothetical protein